MTDAFKKSAEEPMSWASLRGEFEREIERLGRELHEVEMMIEQSHLEVDRLQQRNSLVTVNLQQVQNALDTMPRTDIRGAYESALESQQRLFIMRGQLEKLQSDQSHLKKQLEMRKKVLGLMEAGIPANNNNAASATKVSQGTIDKLETMIKAQESERQRLSHQIHDGPAQALSNFILQTEIAMRLFDRNPEKAREELANLKSSATSAFQKVRDFITELRPMMLDDLGLIPTLKRYVDAYKEQHNIDARLNILGTEQRFDPTLEVMIFRSVQELMGNAVRHSQATQVKIVMDISDATIQIGVDDNGQGFDMQSMENREGSGIRLIKDRVEMLGGVMKVDSKPGQGAHIQFEVPIMRSAVRG